MKISEQTLEVGQFHWFYRQIEPIQSTDAAPIVLLHGLPSQSLCWTGVMPLLAEKGLRAIAPDWLGFGFSDILDKRDFAYTIAAYEQALGELLTALELPKISLVVQGFLATVGIEYALNHPEQIERLAILNTPVIPPVSLPWPMRQWTIPLVGDMVTQDPLIIDRTLEGGSGFVISDERLNTYRKPWLKTSAAGRALMAATKNLPTTNDLAKIGDRLRGEWQKPTCLIWGTADKWLSVEPIEHLVQGARHLELVKLPEAKHYPQEHFPQEVGETLQTFFRKQIA
ncbi:alpha/beta fold hydrolase [Synechocystis sp. PCC 7339]|uniref:alpha/beta fold hydrolase n=1 Tax=unclassified Synechocystis TaxID=2640012 RepID=UPI001BB0003C|nr:MULTISPECIES: alpha/beta fold hydrolase [unclassified Synechocystis]QUS61874.1 alpha/beta fold hydrolase [Synechocystis sp. PCC 7338]UAJ74069.1 alpha/beta fold hydrolase [Synechocystis sp. PCC 7339]